jgi:hypothetical protein
MLTLLAMLWIAPTMPQGAAPQAPNAATAAESPLVIDPPLIDLGAIAPGSVQTRTFTLRNVSGKPVTIVSAFPSCKCTTLTDLAGKEIAPGASVELKASMDAPKAPGPKDAKVFVTLKDGSKPLIAKMEGVVTLPVQPSPAFINALKGNRKGVIDFTSSDGKPFRILSVEGAPPVFTDFDPAKDAPRSHYLVQWDLSMVPDGKFRQWLLVETDRPDCPLIPLRVRNEGTGARFDPDVDKRGWFIGESVVLAGRMKPGEARDVVVDYENSVPKGKAPMPYWDVVRGVGTQDPAIAVQFLGAEKQGDRMRVKMRVTTGLKASGLVYAPVTIETGTGGGRCFVAAMVAP